MSHINITQKEKDKSRSLESIPSLESLQTDCNGIANDLLLIWKVARISSVSPTVLDIARPEETMPGFSAFCSRVLPLKEASKIGYFPPSTRYTNKPYCFTRTNEKTCKSITNPWK